MILILLTGALAGAGHVVLSPDHLAALAPFSIEAGRRAWLIGLRWGIGHSAGLATVGALLYALVERLDPELLARGGDTMIGLVLIGIGLWSFHHLRAADPAAHAAPAAPAHVHAGAAFLVGALHGIAGTGSLVGVLPALAMHSWSEAATYLGGFALGTIGSMVAVAALLGLVTPGAQARRAYRSVFAVAASVALVIGSAWIALPWLGYELHSH